MSDEPQVNEETTEDDAPEVEGHMKPRPLNEDAEGDDDGPDVEGHMKPRP
jgi:hypothetical protein